MHISVKLNGQQRRHLSREEIEVPLKEVERISDLLSYLQKTYPGIPLPVSSCMAIVNDRACDMDSLLEQNDTVSFMPLFGGG